MCRPQLINLNFYCFIFATLFSIFGCKDIIVSNKINGKLKKGIFLDESLFKVNDRVITIINAPGWDDILIKNPEKLRPINITEYIPFINSNWYLASVNNNTKQILVQIPNPAVLQTQPTSEKEASLIFKWNPILITGQKLPNNREVIALFKNVIQVSDLKNEILNKEDIVWMSFGHKSLNEINFLEGKMVEFDKNTQKMVKTYNPKIEDLKPGIYVWAIWAYNEDGTEIVASSREIPFRVSNIN